VGIIFGLYEAGLPVAGLLIGHRFATALGGLILISVGAAIAAGAVS
jgi:hypothetical protein